MKRILLALTMVGFLLPLAPRAQADPEVSLNFFYDNLSDQGSWIDLGNYGYCFQPTVAVDNPDWRPYADGYWAYTDAGWTWVSYEDFGWATYHYGRWTKLDDYGWVWVPGYDWAPAWVSWRTGGDYVGWAPLPPSEEGVYEGRAITGQADVEFDIGPQYYNFIDIRYIGEPVLRSRIFAPSRNVAIINNTVNVTNITYNNSIVYNYGPDYNRLNRYSTRPIPRLSLQHEPVGANFGQGGKRGNFNRVNGNQLMVVSPQIRKSPEKIAPKVVKAKVDKPKIEHGWKGVDNRPQIEAGMKKENARNIPPPSFQPPKGRPRAAAASGPNAGARPNEAVARPAPAVANDQQAAPAARALPRENWLPKPNAAPPDANSNAAQAAALEKQRNAQAQRTQQAGQQNAERARQAQERTTRLDAQRQQQERAQAQELQRAEQAKRASQAQEAQRANRAQQALQAQEAQLAERAQRSAPPPQPREPVQRPQPIRPAQQARPPQPADNQNPSPDAERKGRKKKPAEDNPPQP